ncbi:hypothetical protein E4414_08260 [Leptospira interrogans]|nr:hypothetical protein E4414_08260 [Leptospira interrogans]
MVAGGYYSPPPIASKNLDTKKTGEQFRSPDCLDVLYSLASQHINKALLIRKIFLGGGFSLYRLRIRNVIKTLPFSIRKTCKI